MNCPICCIAIFGTNTIYMIFQKTYSLCTEHFQGVPSRDTVPLCVLARLWGPTKPHLLVTLPSTCEASPALRPDPPHGGPLQVCVVDLQMLSTCLEEGGGGGDGGEREGGGGLGGGEGDGGGKEWVEVVYPNCMISRFSWV